jgi:hypothetical protein
MLFQLTTAINAVNGQNDCANSAKKYESVCESIFTSSCIHQTDLKACKRKHTNLRNTCFGQFQAFYNCSDIP